MDMQSSGGGNAAHNIVRRLGGHAETARITGRHVANVYRWVQDSHIPNKPMRAILDHAAANGIDVQASDFFDPRRLDDALSSDETATSESAGA